MDRRLVLIIPPEYFPTLEIAACMLRADVVVLLDTAQYSRQSFQNRTRIRNPEGFQWLTIPILSGQFGDSIASTHVDESSGWRRQHAKALRFNYSTSPFFLHYRPKLDAILGSESDQLGDLTSTAMRITSDLLGTETTVARASRMEGGPDSSETILASIPNSVCLNPASAPVSSAGSGAGSGSGNEPAGEAVHPVRARDRVICSFKETPWRQNFDGFVSGMSSLDLLFNLGPGARDHLLANSTLTF